MYSQWFTGLVVENLKLAPDVIDVICAVLSRSAHLKTLILRNCALGKEFVLAMSQAMETNCQRLPLEVIDLSDNAFEDAKCT